MASYTSPTATEILDWTGINVDMLGQTSAALTTLIETLRTQAEAEVAMRVTVAKFESSSNLSQENSLLQQAVAYETAARFLQSPEVRRLTGTHEPLLMGNVEDAIIALRLKAADWVDLIAQGQGEERQILHPFSTTTDDLRVFTRDMTW